MIHKKTKIKNTLSEPKRKKLMRKIRSAKSQIKQSNNLKTFIAIIANEKQS